MEFIFLFDVLFFYSSSIPFLSSLPPPQWFFSIFTKTETRKRNRFFKIPINIRKIVIIINHKEQENLKKKKTYIRFSKSTESKSPPIQHPHTSPLPQNRATEEAEEEDEERRERGTRVVQVGKIITRSSRIKENRRGTGIDLGLVSSRGQPVVINQRGAHR